MLKAFVRGHIRTFMLLLHTATRRAVLLSGLVLLFGRAISPLSGGKAALRRTVSLPSGVMARLWGSPAGA